MAKPERTQPDKFDALYQWLSYELQQAKDALMTEVRLSSAQIGALYQEMKNDSDEASKAVSQEIRYSYKQNQTIYDGLAAMLSQEVSERLNSMDEKLVALEQLQTLLNELNEIKYNYMHLQAICSDMASVVSNEVNPKLDAISNKQVLLDQIESVVEEINAKLEGYLPTEEDYRKLAETIAEKTEESVSEHSRQVIEAVSGIAVPENVDYDRIVEEVGDKVLELLNEIKGAQQDEKLVSYSSTVDYDRIICGAAEKVVESLPYNEKVDYSRIEKAAAIDMDALAEAVAGKIVVPQVNYERLADLVVSKIAVPEVDYERLADLVVSKIVVPEAPAAPEVDCEGLADLVVEKIAAGSEQTCEVILDDAGIAEIAEKVSERIVTGVEAIDYDKVCQAAQAAQILPDPVDYDRIAEIVEDKLSGEEPTYDLVIDEEGISAIAKGVSEELCQMYVPCDVEAVEEAPIEETVEEVVEEAPVEEIIQESFVEETVEEVVEEAPVEEAPVEEPIVEETVEEVVEETPVEQELAATSAPIFEEVGNELVDAETGLVIRLKRSFTAKMKQSEEKVKGYYSDLKNELTSYKKINSNVSWHGDRFNFGRDTVAKINICGKTLCFYLALDPNDEENFKTTVYHQKDVGEQKAYENTPFMVKIKSDAAAKKALRLVGYLAEKLGTEKEENPEVVDYVEEFAYESTKQLFDEGFIKATKEKKVEFDF